MTCIPECPGNLSCPSLTRTRVTGWDTMLLWAYQPSGEVAYFWEQCKYYVSYCSSSCLWCVCVSRAWTENRSCRLGKWFTSELHAQLSDDSLNRFFLHFFICFWYKVQILEITISQFCFPEFRFFFCPFKEIVFISVYILHTRSVLNFCILQQFYLIRTSSGFFPSLFLWWSTIWFSLNDSGSDLTKKTQYCKNCKVAPVRWQSGWSPRGSIRNPFSPFPRPGSRDD